MSEIFALDNAFRAYESFCLALKKSIIEKICEPLDSNFKIYYLASWSANASDMPLATRNSLVSCNDPIPVTNGL